jgi:hypothetical protein
MYKILLPKLIGSFGLRLINHGVQANDILDVHDYGRPIVSYAGLIWWPKIKKKVCMNKLTQLQRTTCIGIMGAFRTTPTPALEVAIDLTPFPLWIEGEARASYFRICLLVMLPKGVTLHI